MHQSKKPKRDEEGGTPPPCSGELGELVRLPHELLCHVFPGLPQSTIMKLSRSSRHCRQAAREAIPRIQAALVASVKDGWGRATGAQMRMLMTLLERFAGCRDIATNEPLRLQGDEEVYMTRCVSPEGDLHSSPQRLRDLRIVYDVHPLRERTSHDRAGEPSIKMMLRFEFCSYIVINFHQRVARGIVASEVLELDWARCCRGVDIGQALLLTFLPLWRGRVVQFNGPLRSLRQCAAIMAGCDVIENYKHSRDKRYTFDGTDWAPETSVRGREIRVMSYK
eukprot:jgi/Botrbrau1/7796/Bobra.0159s0224.1